MPAPDPLTDCMVPARTIMLRGAPLTLRMLGPGDAARLQEFFYSHTIDTIQMRYGHAVARMTHERAFDLVSVDQMRDPAIAIFAMEGSREVIHAVGRYYLDPDGRSAEVAFVVGESKRRGGLGALLLQALVDVARARGLDALRGHVRRDNLPMLTLFRRFDGQPVASAEVGDSDVDMRILLRPAPTAALPQPMRPRQPAVRRRTPPRPAAP